MSFFDHSYFVISLGLTYLLSDAIGYSLVEDGLQLFIYVYSFCYAVQIKPIYIFCQFALVSFAISQFMAGHLDLSSASALAIFFSTGIALVFKKTDFSAERPLSPFLVLLVFSLWFFIYYSKISASENTTYYGLVLRGDIDSILDAGYVFFALAAGIMLRVNANFMIAFSTFFYWMFPARAFLLHIVFFIKRASIGGFYKFFILIGFFAFACFNLISNPYFLVKVFAVMSGEEQRFSALACGLSTITSMDFFELIFGMEIEKRIDSINQCLPNSRSIESDFLDVILSVGFLGGIFYISLCALIVRRFPILLSLVFVSSFFGHFVFNGVSIALFFLIAMRFRISR